MSMVVAERLRVLLAAGPGAAAELSDLFVQEPLQEWEALTAESFAHARFVLQHRPCDLLVVNSDLVDREGGQGLAWLAFQKETPVLFLGGEKPDPYARANEFGIHHCLARRLAVAHPLLLANTMRQTLKARQMEHAYQRTRQQLVHSRRHVDRLVKLIWRVTPRHDDQWYSQRHMLDRLQEELVRCQRYSVPLSVALGELHSDDREAPPRLPETVAERLLRGKRRCDIVGQYGPGGFLLLMVHTPRLGGVKCCKRLQDHLRQTGDPSANGELPLRSYFGVASTAIDSPTPQALLHLAEKNLEEARKTPPSSIVAK